MTDMSPCQALVRLDRRMSRAVAKGGGINLSADELELLASLGMITLIAESKAKALEEQARCRRLRVVSTSEGHTGSISSGEPMGGPSAIAGISGGTTPPQDASSGEARAQRMFG